MDDSIFMEDGNFMEDSNFMDRFTRFIREAYECFFYDAILIIPAFLIWLWSLIVIIIAKKYNSSSPEIIGLKKKITRLNIALICVTAWRIYSLHEILYDSFDNDRLFSNLAAAAMIVVAVLCINDSIRLFKIMLQAKPQLGQQNYQQQSYIPPQQEQAAPQPQPQQDMQFCPNCGTELQEDSCFCTQCGTKV